MKHDLALAAAAATEKEDLDANAFESNLLAWWYCGDDNDADDGEKIMTGYDRMMTMTGTIITIIVVIMFVVIVAISYDTLMIPDESAVLSDNRDGERP